MMKKPEEPSTELIVVTQLPVIKDQLLAVKSSIEERVNEALSLVCTEETYKDVKRVRSELNKEFQQLEQRRKEIKAQILAPYEEFEAVYKECAGDKYTRADQQLRQKIAEVETGLKAEKEADLTRFFEDYRKSLGIPDNFVQREAACIKVGLSDSKISLHKQATEFLDRIAADINVIASLENGDEVMAEYIGKYNLQNAMLTVDNRHKMIAAQQKAREEAEARRKAQEASIQSVAQVVQEETPAVPAPVKAPEKEAVVENPQVYTTTFTVKGTIEMLKALKQFLNEGGYIYE